MSQVHCNKKRQSGQHLKLSDREVLEYLYQVNQKLPKYKRKTQKELAKDLGWSEATLSRELKRGLVKQLSSSLEEYWIYSAQVAQEKVERNWENKGPQLKLGTDHALAAVLENMLLGEKVSGLKPLKYSPEAIVMHFDRKGWPTGLRVCARTIYNYVKGSVFSQVTRLDLPRRGAKSKSGYKRLGKRLHPPEYKRIHERSLEAEARLEAGHWEMDCIESRKTDRTCLLTMIDRQTRECLIFKLGSQTQGAVLRRLNGLERQMGTATFREKFKSITVDNGSEFLNWRAMEKSVFNKEKRTQIYFASAYASWERGSNENLNGFIRYFIPRGTLLKAIKESAIKRLEAFINHYPRKILEGNTALSYGLTRI